MTAFGENNQFLRHGPVEGLESPFLDEALFLEETEAGWEPRLGALEAESPFIQLDLPALEQEKIGPIDDRTVVHDTLKIPNRWICAIDILTSDPAANLRGTGILIGPRYVLTARHIWPPDANELFVSPARNGSNSSNPFGRVKAKGFRYPKPHYINLPVQQGRFAGTQTRFPDDNDYMLIILKQDLASITHPKMKGTLGYWGQNPAQAVIRLLESDTIQDKEIVIIGYPGDTCGIDKFSGSEQQKRMAMNNCVRTRKSEWSSRQWQSGGVVDARTNIPSRMYHTADTYKGQSGAPICLTLGGTLHLAGIHIDEDSPQRNKGLRITERMLRNLCAWMNADAGYTIASIKDNTLIVQPKSATEVSTREFFDDFEEDEGRAEDLLFGNFDEPEFSSDQFENDIEAPYEDIDSGLVEESWYPDDETEDEEAADSWITPGDVGLLVESEKSGPRAEVRALQESINKWRAANSQPPINEDGVLGSETKKAVLEFQKASGLKKQDGIAGPATRERLSLLLDILNMIPAGVLFDEDRRRLLEFLSSAGFRSLEASTQTEALRGMRSYQQSIAKRDNARLLAELVAQSGFELVPSSSQKLMLLTLAARPDDADLAFTLSQLAFSKGFRSLQVLAQSDVLKRIKAYGGNRARIDNLENLITTTLHFDELSKESQNVMLTALRYRPNDAQLVDNFHRVADNPDFRGLEQFIQTDVLNRVVAYPRGILHIDNLMSLATTPGFKDLGLDVRDQILDRLPVRYETVSLDPGKIANLMNMVTASRFDKLPPKAREIMLDFQANRPDNAQLANALRNLVEDPKFWQNLRMATQMIQQVDASIP